MTTGIDRTERTKQSDTNRAHCGCPQPSSTARSKVDRRHALCRGIDRRDRWTDMRELLSNTVSPCLCYDDDEAPLATHIPNPTLSCISVCFFFITTHPPVAVQHLPTESRMHSPAGTDVLEASSQAATRGHLTVEVVISSQSISPCLTPSAAERRRSELDDAIQRIDYRATRTTCGRRGVVARLRDP